MPANSADPAATLASSLTTIEATSPVSAVSRRLLDLFASGAVEPGARLPAERQLAASLGVGRSAIRESLAALEVLGIVTVKPGSGTYLRGKASELLPDTLNWGLLIGTTSTQDLLQVRSALEIHVARLAAAQGSAENLEAADAALKATDPKADDLASFAAADRAFHDAIATAAGNTILRDQLEVVRTLLRVYENRAVRTHEDAILAHIEHRAILIAISAGDEDAASSAMAAHMKTANQRLANSLG